MFKFSQSSLKGMEAVDACPLKWQAVYVNKEWKRTPSLAMLKGSYFEQLWLGSGATDEVVLDLPRKKKGDKTIDQIRIEEQAERAKQLFDPLHKDFLGFVVHKTQLRFESDDKEGTADIWATDKEGESWLIDCKLTEDLTNTWGDYGWGKSYDELDLIQLPHYQDLFELQYGHRPRMALFIADYSPKKRIEFNEIVVTDQRRQSKDYRFSQARKIYEEYRIEGFPTFPSKKECATCKLTCKDRYEDPSPNSTNDSKTE